MHFGCVTAFDMLNGGRDDARRMAKKTCKTVAVSGFPHLQTRTYIQLGLLCRDTSAQSLRECVECNEMVAILDSLHGYVLSQVWDTTSQFDFIYLDLVNTLLNINFIVLDLVNTLKQGFIT